MTQLVNEEIFEKKQNEDLDELFRELGKAYYEGAYEDPLPQLLPLFDRISEILKGEEEPPVIQCAGCGAELDEDARFCEVCGMAVEQMQEEHEPSSKELVCLNCGNPLRAGAVFCGMCGTKVE